MAKKEYATGGGVVVDGNQILLLERPKRNEIRLPKGHIDPGETAEQAALREVAEETGYADLEILHDLGERVVEFEHNGDHYRRAEHYFVMGLRSHLRRPRPPADEAQFRVWWTSAEIAVLALTFPAEQAVVEAALAAIAPE